MFECYHCGKKTLVWDNDFSGDDANYDNVSVVHMLHCTNCGAFVEYLIPDKEEDEHLEVEEE